MTAPTKSKKAQKADTVSPKKAQATARHTAKKQHAAPSSEVSVRTVRSESAAVAFKAPAPVPKGMPASGKVHMMPSVKQPLDKKPARALKSLVRPAEGKAGNPRSTATSATKELFPVFTAWPEHATQADIETVAEYFSSRSEGCID